MAVDDRHPDYDAMKPEWDRVRAVVAGQAAMRASADLYLRRAPGMVGSADAERVWQGYVLAAPFFPGTGRALQGMSGMAFYDDPVVTVPDATKTLLVDVTGDGVAIGPFLKRTLEEVLSVGRVGVLVDFPTADPNIQNRAQEEAANRQPFIRHYKAESILNWSTMRIGSKVVLSEVRLAETETYKIDRWTYGKRAIIRVLELVQADTGWIYQQTVFRALSDSEVELTGNGADQGDDAAAVAEAGKWDGGEVVTPLFPGAKPLDYIPFWIINPTDQTVDIQQPPLLALANVNISHFNTSAQLENVLFYAGNPQLYITGVEPDATQQLLIGSPEAWLLKNAESKVDFASPGTEGVASLEGRLNRFEQHMAVLGARLLAPDMKQAETAETARIHRQGEMSVLVASCASVSAAMLDAMSVAVAWAGSDGEVILKIVTDFFDERLTSADVINLVSAWMQGAIGYTDLLFNLKRGGVVEPDRTADEIASDLQSSPVQPILPVMKTVPDTGTSGDGAGGGDS